MCGDCQARFPLHDIVHFIRHKKLCCDKENLSSSDCRKQDNNNDTDDEGHDSDQDDDPDDTAQGVALHDKPRPRDSDEVERGGKAEGEVKMDDEDEPTDLSAKNKVTDLSSKNKLNDLNGKRSPISDLEVMGTDLTCKTKVEVKEEVKVKELRLPLKQKQLVDAESNTTHSGKI